MALCEFAEHPLYNLNFLRPLSLHVNLFRAIHNGETGTKNFPLLKSTSSHGHIGYLKDDKGHTALLASTCFSPTCRDQFLSLIFLLYNLMGHSFLPYGQFSMGEPASLVINRSTISMTTSQSRTELIQ